MNGDARIPGFTPADNKDLAEYFLALSRIPSGRIPPSPEEKIYGKDYAPKELNPTNGSGGFALISKNKRSVKYPTVDRHDSDVGVVQANRPVPGSWPLYYFEIHVKNRGAKGRMTIGFTGKTFNMTRQPGLEVDSCAYRGDNGRIYEYHREGRPLCLCMDLPFTTNDTVGAGINSLSNEFFFTKNGIRFGTVKKEIQGPLFPTASVHSQNEEIEVNFGRKQFSFDIKEYERQERTKERNSKLPSLDDTLLSQNVRDGLIRSYLLHNGYEETLNSFELDSKSTFPLLHMSQEDEYDPGNALYAFNERSQLRQLIKGGSIDAAIGKLREWFPQILEDEKSATCFLLKCQKFIELVRAGKLEEASTFGSTELTRFSELVDYNDLVQDCASLMGYQQPMESSAGYLLQDWQRIVVAETVNAKILLTNPKGKYLHECLQSYMEKLVRQLMDLCYLEKRYKNQN